MVFSSPFFISLFFPVLLLTYFLAPEIARNAILLAFSLFFYAWGEPRALPLMLLVIAFNYWIALRIEKARSRVFLILGALFNLLLLGLFKYLDFLIANLNILLAWANFDRIPLPHIILPIGISFYIFQAISYIIDIGRGSAGAQRNIFRFALYISLFPQLIAGPIVRYLQIEPDLGKRGLVIDNISAGLIRFCIGLGKKVFIADSLGFVADKIFGAHPETVPCFWAWIGAITYAMQIYYDFSAYSDMAIGIGRIFNFRFPENFNYPYASRTIQEFWRRWHMSLTQWLIDYLYIPLGGSRVSTYATYRNIIIVLACCGIWHGAAWTFVIWGIYNGAGLVIERLCGRLDILKNKPLLYYFHWLLTLIFILAGWVIFRAEDLTQAMQYLKIMFFGNTDRSFFDLPVIWEECFTYSNCLFLGLALFFSQPHRKITFEIVYSSWIWQAAILILFGASYAFVMTGNYSPFLYFRF